MIEFGSMRERFGTDDHSSQCSYALVTRSDRYDAGANAAGG